MTRGYIFRKTRKNTIAMLFWAVVFIVFYILYLSSALVYLVNAHSSGYKLNTTNLLSNVNMLTIKPQSDPFETQELGVTLPPFIRRTELYEEGLKYRFKFTLESYEELGLGYGLNDDKTLKMLYGNPETKSMPPDTVQKIALIKIQGVNFVALLPRETELKAGDTVTHAIFTDLPLYVGHDIGLTDHAGIEVASYIADLRHLTVEDENMDFILVILFTLLFPSFLVYSVLCLFKPQIHPNYIRIAKFGDIEKVCAEIDKEIDDESTYREKKQIFTKHYIIEETLYNTRVRKNHLLRH